LLNIYVNPEIAFRGYMFNHVPQADWFSILFMLINNIEPASKVASKFIALMKYQSFD